MLEVIPIPAFRDNYIWLLRRKGHAVVVDPGDAAPVLALLAEQQLQLDAILVTHHHDDHIGGVTELVRTFPISVYAPRKGHYAFPHQPVGEGDCIDLTTLDICLQVLETPGHTLDHVAYYGANSLFCGDTLFSCGCGRLFEGSCEQLYASLQRLAALPLQTRVYCAHEYTLDNIRFALAVDPGNADLALRKRDVERCRADGRPSLPSSLALECATNPFLRCDSASVQSAAMATAPFEGNDPAAVFCAIRKLKNSF
ncbi:MAG TPA: hydroxyacylglutathione hydrolase [Methylophilaceae bacterium]|nr:hydroxyacylglutathione hydrolase [Methylophilaceae bacterium]HQR59917.1 hydroxyacylglutathione hydrolase [Methylophilaceae bacterium]